MKTPILGVYLGMGKMQVLKFLAEARSDQKGQSDYRLDELHAQLKPEIELSKLNIYLLDLRQKGWVKPSDGRQNAYRISNAGRIYYSSSLWSRISMTHRLVIITIAITTIIGLLNLWYCSCP